MSLNNDNKSRRLSNEAEFQNKRMASVAAGHTEPRGKFYFVADIAVATYERLVAQAPGERALVVGCSEGGVTPLARLGKRVTGIDIAEEAVSRHAARIDREGLASVADVIVMDAEDLKFPPQTFDLICCVGVLHHLDTRRAAAEWSRCIRPGGQVIVLEPMAFHPLVALYRSLTPSMRTPDEHPLRPADVRILRSYFDRVDLQGFVLLSAIAAGLQFVPRGDIIGRKLLPFLQSIDAALIKYLPFLSYFCWTGIITMTAADARTSPRIGAVS